ncbi:hypothetical protein EIP91_003476 [Steccherinum ochraceum]|uniref:Microbial-type PARG catalytic domain-containing protein n=1 Tax=Steccherinum ochraceum TaxID=92696 RepID=A0A4R0RUU3_9APHY|nr:hypothetical protein EIP91_003476 [Steccherinum ochraceum]
MSSASLRAIATDTVSRIPFILEEVREGSLDSTFVEQQLPMLTPDGCPNHSPSKVSVVNLDAFTAAREMMKKAIERGESVQRKVTVLNLANDRYPAGGWGPKAMFISKTQEEALCYSSTLYPTLKQSYYPWRGRIAGIYSPSVVIFKNDLDHGCVDLTPDERKVVSVITVAAEQLRTQPADGKMGPESLYMMREKIRLVYRMAASNGQTYLVLGAMGCGAFNCPPAQIAEEMKAILLEDEFRGWFREVVFAVYAGGSPNFDIFRSTLDGVELNSVTKAL